MLSKNRYSAVIDLCESQLESEQDDGEFSLDAIYFRAYAHSKMGQTGEALNDIEYLVFVQDPRNVKEMVLKANVLKVLDQAEEAQDLYERVLGRDPNNTTALLSLAKYYLTKPEYIASQSFLRNSPEVSHTFEKVLKLQGDEITTDHHMTKGLVAHALQRYEDALLHFDRVLELDPEHKAANKYRAVCLALRTNNPESSKIAITNLNKILETNPNDKVCLYYKAIALKHISKYKEALEMLKKLVILEPNNHEVLNQIGQLYALEKQHFEAMDYFEKAIAIDRSHISSWRLRAVALYNIGIFDESLECFNEALELIPFGSRNEVLLGKAYTLLAMRKWEDLLQVCDEILQIDPSHLKANELRIQAIGKIGSK